MRAWDLSTQLANSHGHKEERKQNYVESLLSRAPEHALLGSNHALDFYLEIGYSYKALMQNHHAHFLIIFPNTWLVPRSSHGVSKNNEPCMWKLETPSEVV